MKKILILLLAAAVLGACSKSSTKTTAQPQQLFIQDGEFEAATRQTVEGERRAAEPAVDSDYIYRMPATTDAYYFDQQNMPTDQPPASSASAASYKSSYLWKRAKRTMSASYSSSSSSSSQSSSSSSSSSQTVVTQTQTDQSQSADMSAQGQAQSYSGQQDQSDGSVEGS